jgi:hypothetical protein
MLQTGILEVLRNSSKASKDPNVEAWTHTPSLVLSTYFSRISIRLPSISAFASSISYYVFALNNSEPAIA